MNTLALAFVLWSVSTGIACLVRGERGPQYYTKREPRVGPYKIRNLRS